MNSDDRRSAHVYWWAGKGAMLEAVRRVKGSSRSGTAGPPSKECGHVSHAGRGSHTWANDQHLVCPETLCRRQDGQIATACHGRQPPGWELVRLVFSVAGPVEVRLGVQD